MPKVIYKGTDIYTCVKALKGPDYIHLLDDNGVMIVSFDGVKNFNAFSITDGDWSIPTPDDDCSVVVMREDGTLAAGSHRCCDIGVKIRTITLPDSSSTKWEDIGGGAKRYTATVEGLRPTDHVVITAESNKLFVYNNLIIATNTDEIYFIAEDFVSDYESELTIKIYSVS